MIKDNITKKQWIKKIKSINLDKKIRFLAITCFNKIKNNKIYFFLSKKKKYIFLYTYDNLILLKTIINKIFKIKEIIFFQLININLDSLRKIINTDINIQILCNFFNINIKKIYIN